MMTEEERAAAEKYRRDAAQWLLSHPEQKGSEDYGSVAEAFSRFDTQLEQQGKGGNYSPTLGAAQSLASGALWNWADEPFSVGAGIGSLIDEGDFSKGYNLASEAWHGNEEEFRGRNPELSFGLNLAGAIPTVGGVVGNAARGAGTLGGRLVSGGLTGGVVGGVAGAGAGENLAERAAGAGMGGLLGMALGGVGEAAAPGLSKAVNWVARKIFGNTKYYNAATQTLTPKGEQALMEAGINPADLPPDALKVFAEEARKLVRPAHAAISAEAKSLPVPLKLSSGQTTLDPAVQMMESQMVKGGYGSLANTTMNRFLQEQQEALQSNVPAIQRMLAGGGKANVSEAGTGGQLVQKALSGQAAASKAGVDAAYEAARASGGGMAGNRVLAGANRIASAVGEQFDLGTVPVAARLLAGFNRIATANPKGSVLISALYGWRQQATNIARHSAGTPDGAAARTAIKAFDDWMAGSASGLNAPWQNAIGSMAQYGKTFKRGDMVRRLTARDPLTRELKVRPEDAANVLFGKGLAFANRPGLVRDVVRMRELLGANSAEWNALREEAFLRFANKALSGSTPAGQTQFSGNAFLKAWTKANHDSPGLMRALFSDRERSLISRFARIAARATSPVSGGANTSNTAVALVQALRRLTLASFFGPKFGALMANVPIFKGIHNIAGAWRAGRAIKGPPANVIPAVGPAAGYLVGTHLAPMAGQGLLGTFGIDNKARRLPPPR